MSQTNKPTQASPNDVEITCRFGERVVVDRELLKRASDLNLDAPAKLIVTHQPFYAVYSVTRMLVGGQRIQLTVDNVIDFWSTAKALHLRTLVEQLENFVAEHLNEVARVKAEMLKVDDRFLERLLAKRKSKGVSRILYRWWRADVKNRQPHFMKLVNKFTPEKDDETLSASTEETYVLKNVMVLKKKSDSAPALNQMTAFTKPGLQDPVAAESPPNYPRCVKSSLTTPVPSETAQGEPKVPDQARVEAVEGLGDQSPAKAKTSLESVAAVPSPEPTIDNIATPEAASADPEPSKSNTTDKTLDEPSSAIAAPAASAEPLPPTMGATEEAPETPAVEAIKEKTMGNSPTAAEPLPAEAKLPAPTCPTLPPFIQLLDRASAALASPAEPVAAYSLPGRPEAVTAAPQKSVVINKVFGKALIVGATQNNAKPANRTMPKPNFSRRASLRSRSSNNGRLSPVSLTAAPSQSESLNTVSSEPIRPGKHILIGDKICDFQEHSVRSVASVGRDIPPHDTTIVCDAFTRTYAEIDCFGVLRTYLSHIETSTKMQTVRAIMTQLDENRPLLWMSDGSFHAVLDKKLQPCPNEIPDSSPLKNLPNPPHEGWLARMYLGADCALLYYHCWGLYMRRRGEPNWQLRCEDLFIEYLTPIGRSNRFFIVAKRASSFVLYKTGDITRDNGLTFASEPVATLKSWSRHLRCTIVHAASSGVRVVFKIFNVQTATVQLEKMDISALRVNSLPIF